jgi:CspA family cold shock protein
VSDAAGESAPRELLQGEVLWYSEAKGWGMVRDARSREVAVDYTAISGEGFRFLRPGQRVDLELSCGPRGPIAERVTAVAGPKAE